MGTEIINNLTERYPAINELSGKIKEAAETIIKCYQEGGKVLVCGNGGSCASADHIVGELMKGFERKRPVEQKLKDKLEEIAGERGKYLGNKLEKALPAISLNAHSALITAISNDTDASLIFAQQVAGYGNQGDILIGISSSGSSQNVIDAVITARAKEMIVIGMTGATGGRMKQYCDILLNVPETRTALVQELHLPVYHAICLIAEDHFFGPTNH
jgi:D-sedoheptulose 7-phosphate isomerase